MATEATAPKATTLDETDNRVLEHLEANPKGVSINALAPLLGLTTAILMESTNKLTRLGKLELFVVQNIPHVRVVAADKIDKFKGLTVNERLVYQIIEKAGNKGVWTRDLRYQSNVDLKELNKILKMMEGKKMIKAVNSVVAAKKKMYMLFELEPDLSITGGKWYSVEDQEFDSEFTSLLHSLCYKFLDERTKMAFSNFKDNPVQRRIACFASGKDVLDHITKSKISTVELKLQDLEEILTTLLDSNKIEAEYDAKLDSMKYKINRFPEIRGGFVQTPCGMCPVFNVCEEGGVVSPSACQYLKEWME